MESLMKRNVLSAIACVLALTSISSAALAGNRVADISRSTQTARGEAKLRLLQDVENSKKQLDALYNELAKAKVKMDIEGRPLSEGIFVGVSYFGKAVVALG